MTGVQTCALPISVQHRLRTIALGAAIAVSSAGFAQGTGAKTSKPHNAGDKTTTSKTAGKSAKSVGKSGGKTKGAGAESGDETTDSWITMKIKTDLTKEETLKGSDITINTKDKVVTLKGTVPSEQGKARAEQIAKGTQGVTKVVDSLTVQAK